MAVIDEQGRRSGDASDGNLELNEEESLLGHHTHFLVSNSVVLEGPTERTIVDGHLVAKIQLTGDHHEYAEEGRVRSRRVETVNTSQRALETKDHLKSSNPSEIAAGQANANRYVGADQPPQVRRTKADARDAATESEPPKVFHSSTQAKQQRLQAKRPLAVTRYDLGKGNNFRETYDYSSRMASENFAALSSKGKQAHARESVSVQSVDYTQEPFGMTGGQTVYQEGVRQEADRDTLHSDRADITIQPYANQTKGNWPSSHGVNTLKNPRAGIILANKSPRSCHDDKSDQKSHLSDASPKVLGHNVVNLHAMRAAGSTTVGLTPGNPLQKNYPPVTAQRNGHHRVTEQTDTDAGIGRKAPNEIIRVDGTKAEPEAVKVVGGLRASIVSFAGGVEVE